MNFTNVVRSASVASIVVASFSVASIANAFENIIGVSSSCTVSTQNVTGTQKSFSNSVTDSKFVDQVKLPDNAGTKYVEGTSKDLSSSETMLNITGTSKTISVDTRATVIVR